MNKHNDENAHQNVSADAQDAEIRARENEDEHDEGLPSVNRKKKGSKAVSYIIIACVCAFGLFLIVKLNSGPKEKKSSATEHSVVNNLPKIDTTPPPPPVAPPPPPPVTAQATSPTTPAATNGSARPPVRSGDGSKTVHWTERKLSGDLVLKAQGQQPRSAASNSAGGKIPDYGNAGQASTVSDDSGIDSGASASKSNLGSRLTGTATPSVQATLLTNRDFLLAKGASLDCAMDSAIDTALPGIITCTLTTDVYSDNNRTLLMERGTQLVGEQQGNVKQGQARIFALWTRAKTPTGVVINLNSPGADSLGRSGLDGWVDNHFAERFGAAILMSFIQSSLKYAIASQENGSATTIIGDSADSGENVVGKILDNTIAIPPTILKNQGDHINIIVARDLDFSSVYELQEY